jgi:hypothetical protein
MRSGAVDSVPVRYPAAALDLARLAEKLRYMHITRLALSSLMLIAGLGCVEEPVHEGELVNEIATQNGLPAINGLSTQNGLGTQNGLSTQNGLGTQNGLKDGSSLMSTDAGRKTVSYLVKCALPANRSITKKDQYGRSYTFTGALGVAPTWETGSCGQTCQQWVSACIVAHINTAGISVPLWVVATPLSQPQIGWGLSPTYPNQEGSFFGNIFVSPPVMHYCNGRNFNVGVVPGRVGSGSTAPYTNPWGYNTYCDQYCTAADYPNASSGYKACAGYNSVMTVWRQ